MDLRKLLFAICAMLSLTRLAWGIRHDHQLWLFSLYERPLVAPWRFLIFIEGRWRDDASWLNRKVIEGEVIYPFNKWFEVAPGYRNDWDTSIALPHKYSSFHNPFIDFYFNLTKGGERIRNRLRPEYVIREREKNFWLVRNRLTWFFAPIQPKKMNLTPYLQHEIFWRELDGIFENRVYAGANIPLKGHFHLGLFFLHRLKREEIGWEQSEVLGLQLRYIIQGKGN